MNRYALVSLAFATLCSICTAAAGAAEMSFTETISAHQMQRETRIQDLRSSRYWQETLPGHPEFEVLTGHLEYEHSLLGIEPPARPSGTITYHRLTLYIDNQCAAGMELVLDSLVPEQLNRRSFFFGPDPADSLTIEESLLTDGRVLVIVHSHSGASFALHRSVLELGYRPNEPADAIRRDDVLPRRFELGNCFPNPFHPATCIRYELAEASDVHLSIFDAHGKLVRSFAPTYKDAGAHDLLWDGTDGSGLPLPSGIYLYQVTAGSRSDKSRLLMLN